MLVLVCIGLVLTSENHVETTLTVISHLVGIHTQVHLCNMYTIPSSFWVNMHSYNCLCLVIVTILFFTYMISFLQMCKA